HRRADQRRPRRRGLLELDAGRRDPSATDRRPRPGQEPTADATTQERAAPRRRGPPDGSNPRHPARTSALPTPTADRRAGLREHQVPPPRRPLPTTRLTRLPGRVEADRRHPQPAQTLARNPDPGSSLTPAPSISRTERLPETRTPERHTTRPQNRGAL